MLTFETIIRVRYAETDQMGYVYYGNYATYYEVARVEMLRSIGQAYRSLEKNGIMMPVTELQTNFLKPIFYDEQITVRVRMEKPPTVRIRFDYELFNENGDLANTGHTKLVFVDMEKNRPCPPPREFSTKLETFFKHK
jgi:acyl-CoA thioester hydrolase